MAVMESSMIMPGDHGQHCNIVQTLIIQLTLLISNQVVVRYFLTPNMLNEPIKKYPKDVLLKIIF